MDTTDRPLLHTNVDGWRNVYSGLGQEGVDKRVSSTFQNRALFGQADFEALYHQNWLVQRVVETMADEMTREWIEVLVDESFETAEAIAEALEQLDVQSKFREALIWEALFGGSAILMGIDDGQDTDMPVLPARIGVVRFVEVIERWYLYPDVASIDADPSSPTFGQPLIWVMQLQGGTQRRIHTSRLLTFKGALATRTWRLSNQGWGLSKLEPVYDAIRDWGTALDGAATSVQDFVWSVLKMQGLADALDGDDGDKVVTNRVKGFKLGLGMAKLALIDAEGEELTRMGAPVTGLADLLDRFREAVAGAAKIPSPILFGQSKGTLAGADADIRTFYDQVRAAQNARVLPLLKRLVDVVCLSRDGPTSRKIPTYKLKPRSLWQATDKEQAEARKVQADVDKAYLDAGVLYASEVRESRFGGAGYSFDTVIDEDLSALLEESESDPPEPAPLPGSPDPGSKEPPDKAAGGAEDDPKADPTSPQVG